MMLRRARKRSGHAIVESALVYPFLFLLLLGIMLLGIAVFRFQQVSHMAQEGARYAIVHGAQRQAEGIGPAASSTDIYDKAIKPHAAGMNLNNLTYNVAWTASNTQTSSVPVGSSGNAVLVTKANYVSVTVTYTWNTGLFGTIPVSRTACSTMSY
jgi:Flp pilus assembly protein TadG